MEAQANHWAARRCVGALDADEERRLQSWLRSDERHAGALLRAEAAIALIARADILAPVEPVATPMSRHSVVGWGIAGTVAAGGAGLWLLAPRSAFETEVGEIRRTGLPDTSVVTLNTQSRVSVDMMPHERRLTLDRGEAWFQVAHDRSRPFIVSAANVRVLAVGTAFSVRRMAGGADVLVTEGRIKVWRADQPDQQVMIRSGQRAFVPDDSVAIVPVAGVATIDRKLAWREGKLILAGETLDFAIGEMNRYNDVQLRVDDPDLNQKPIIGLFHVGDPTGFARSVAALEAAKVVRDGATIRLIPAGS